MPGVYIASDNVFSPVGLTTAENFAHLKIGVTGIQKHYDAALSAEPFYASLFTDRKFNSEKHTKFEQLLIASIRNALVNSEVDVWDNRTLLIISSTKGNISLLETEINSPALQQRVALNTSASLVAENFGFVKPPLVVSNACISGIMAILTGMRLIQSGQYDNVVVSGADVISKFVLSGFQSFQAISSQPCKPFDLNRDGITLGEGAATVILSNKKNNIQNIKVLSGAVSNDANHISAPSRTGAELSQAISKSLQQSNLTTKDIDFISAHGTATVYNDEMEAKALTHSDLQNAPLNSLKGYYGHTLGAAGLIEAIISIQSLKEGILIPTLGFNQIGVSTPVNVCKELLIGDFKNCLKIASGFGGCNAAMVFSKD